MLSNGGGVISSTRLMALVCIVAANFIAIFTSLKGTLSVETIGLVGTLLTAGFTGKVMQKRIEAGVAAEVREP